MWHSPWRALLNQLCLRVDDRTCFTFTDGERSLGSLADWAWTADFIQSLVKQQAHLLGRKPENCASTARTPAHLVDASKTGKAALSAVMTFDEHGADSFASNRPYKWGDRAQCQTPCKGAACYQSGLHGSRVQRKPSMQRTLH